MPSTVLIVDDDIELTQMLAEYLGTEGFEVSCAHDGHEAVAMGTSGNFNLIILDLMLPGISGFEVLTRLRQDGIVPVLMLTARGADLDRITGLDLGADDYLPKPFNPRELVSRMRAILRRFAVQAGLGANPPMKGPLEIDPTSFTARLRGKDLALTGTEFRLLECLAQAPGDIMPRDMLTQRVLERSLNPFDRSIDTHISNIRRKLEAVDSAAVDIKSIRGKGYALYYPRHGKPEA